jgi:hypothetical protein
MRQVSGTSKPTVLTSVFDWIRTVVARGGNFANKATVNVINLFFISEVFPP